MHAMMTGILAVSPLFSAVSNAVAEQTLRPPAVPLVVHDPYLSIWSFADALAADWPRHWTGAIHALESMIRIDGRPRRLMGISPQSAPALPQKHVRVWPTRTVYTFEGAGVRVRMTFMSPVLPDDLDVLSRPVTYVTWTVEAIDGGAHDVQIYYDNSAEPAVNTADQPVIWGRVRLPGLEVMRIGSQEQAVLEKSGDNLRIDWGWWYVAVPDGQDVATVICDDRTAREGFAGGGRLPDRDDTEMPRPARERWPVCAVAFNLGRVGARPVSRTLMLAYDDRFSVTFLGRPLRPWWRRNGATAGELLSTAFAEFAKLEARCRAFDEQLMREAQEAGGRRYADLCALAYRQAFGGGKLVAGPDGEPMFFTKECFSNGCMATVDVAYPTSPVFMRYALDVLEAMLRPVLEYAASDRWRFPFAPHDLGRYPRADGQVYGGGEKSSHGQMPVEECGNMLLMTAVLCILQKRTEFADRYRAVLDQWAGYLVEHGADPENQLCTDDFAGHLAHNTNLAAKATEALGAYAEVCNMQGRNGMGERLRKTAEAFAAEWVRRADDGDHYRLAFDKPGTWSQKYNLVWDRILGLHLFPQEVIEKEIAFYKARLLPYGLPLDNRATYTKLDWEAWTAALSGRRQDFDAVMEPVYRFVHETPDRVPLTDWYWADSGKRRGFQARPVVGGVFIEVLARYMAVPGGPR